MSRFLLNTDKVYEWNRADKVYFRGYMIVDGKLYKGQEAIEFLCHNTSQLYDYVTQMNGVFDIIIEGNDRITMVVDRLRSLPIFYAVSNNCIYVSDDAFSILKSLEKWEINNVSLEEFKSSYLFVSGRNTLIDGVFQVQAGNIVQIDKKDFSIKEIPYYEVKHENFISNMDLLGEMFDNAYGIAGDNLIRALNGRTAVIPLSGGADSRMVLAMLKKKGYEKIICYSYGKTGNEESRISQSIAEQYNVKWIMIPYTKSMWRNIRRDEATYKYYKRAFNLTSTPHMQDYPAVKYLADNNLIPKDSVFVPGHSGDLIAGSHITKEFLGTSLRHDHFLETVITKFYKIKPSEMLKHRIDLRFPQLSETDVEGMASQSEWFNIQERQAKFIVNSCRVYEFFGYEWLIPLWDNALFDFWKNVPIDLRFNRNFYFYHVDDKMPSTNDGSIKKSIGARIREMPVIRTLIRRLVRFYRYIDSPLLAEHLFAMPDFYYQVFFGIPTFSVDTIQNTKQIKMIRKLYGDERRKRNEI